MLNESITTSVKHTNNYSKASQKKEHKQTNKDDINFGVAIDSNLNLVQGLGWKFGRSWNEIWRTLVIGTEKIISISS